MNRPKEIQINQFQLARLLSEEQMGIYKSMLVDNVFCTHCEGTCKNGITITELFLTSLNDIKVNGTCNTCDGKVSRILEFGENKSFYVKATDFRNSDGKE